MKTTHITLSSIENSQPKPPRGLRKKDFNFQKLLNMESAPSINQEQTIVPAFSPDPPYIPYSGKPLTKPLFLGGLRSHMGYCSLRKKSHEWFEKRKIV
jgi:hypothetical protein